MKKITFMSFNYLRRVRGKHQNAVRGGGVSEEAGNAAGRFQGWDSGGNKVNLDQESYKRVNLGKNALEA
jgi:hypothetical protein